MSTHSTRWPCSANAAARLSVVVVLATPPFWLAKAITRAVLAAAEELFKPDTSPLFARAGPIPSPAFRRFATAVRGLRRGAGAAGSAGDPRRDLRRRHGTLQVVALDLLAT